MLDFLGGLGGMFGGAANPTALPAGFEGPTLSGAEAAALPGQGGFDLAGAGQKLGQALQGVKAPAAPEVPKLGLPGYAPAPRAPTPIQSGEFLKMLQMLGGPAAQSAPPTTTLSGALGRR